MIVRNRRKRESLLRRLTRSFSRIKPPAGHRNIASPERFQLEIDKEIQRSNRRENDPEFAVISLDFSDHKVSDPQLNALTYSFQDRIRVSDTVGWHQMKLAILLPETGREGAMLVCNSIVKLANESNVELEASISIYPWDDRLLGTFSKAGDTFEKRSKGSDSHPWSDNDSDEFLGGINRSVGSKACAPGGTATLGRPVKMTEVKSSLACGTGVHVLFSQSEKTPTWKRSIDIAGAGVGLILLSPFLLATAATVKLTSNGPVFFRQQREGKDGSVFQILKFRTMFMDAEEQKDDLRKHSEQDGPAFKLTNDPRVTPVGKYLRMSCVDELPQLFNILVGDMSIVGPRPLPVNESQQCLPWQRQRLAILPGLTCTWQARGGRHIKFAEWMRMDLDYIQRRGFWYDLRLIGETAVVVVMHKGSV